MIGIKSTSITTNLDIQDWKSVTHNRIMFFVGMALLASALTLFPFWLMDPTEILGVSQWEKPMKFFISTGIFCLTYSWLSSHITRFPHLVWWIGALIAISLAIEMIAITGAAALETTSHFNVSNPLSRIVWSTMSVFISIVFMSTVFLSVLILIEQQRTLLLRVGLGLGSAITSLGLGIAFTMTGPTEEQIGGNQAISGAHSVGVADGGPGLPLLGWSTVAGDLRAGHFFGVHAIQVAIIFLLIQRHLPKPFRFPLIIVGNLTYASFVLIVTGQALRAEPFSSPSNQTLWLFGLLGLASITIFGFMSLFENQRIKREANVAN